MGRLGELVEAGRLLLNGATVRNWDPVATGDVLSLTPEGDLHLTATEAWVPTNGRSISVLHEDEDVIVVDKPHGIHMNPMGRHRDDTLLGAMLRVAGADADSPWTQWRPHPVHRLDRPVGGIVVYAKHREARATLQDDVEARRVQRTYRARVHGKPAADTGTVDLPLGHDPANVRRRTHIPVRDGGRTAVTHWSVVASHPGGAELELQLDTGRTHQIRAHLLALGHPIVGDVLYGAEGRGLATADGLPRIDLAAVNVSLPHPRTGRVLTAAVEPSWAP